MSGEGASTTRVWILTSWCLLEAAEMRKAAVRTTAMAAETVMRERFFASSPMPGLLMVPP